jgi:hypothetical protein
MTKKTTWTATPRFNAIGAYTIDEWDSNNNIAVVGSEYTGAPTAAKNAALLSAAPAMLAALEQIAKIAPFAIGHYALTAIALATRTADQLQADYELVMAEREGQGGTVQLPTPTADDLAYLAAAKIDDERLTRRITIERAIVRKTALTFIAAGYRLRVLDGEDWACDETTDLAVVMDAIMSTDEDYLYAFRQMHTGEWREAGSVRFIYGNDGWDVLADHSTNLSEVLKPVDAYVDALSALC